VTSNTLNCRWAMLGRACGEQGRLAYFLCHSLAGGIELGNPELGVAEGRRGWFKRAAVEGAHAMAEQLRWAASVTSNDAATRTNGQNKSRLSMTHITRGGQPRATRWRRLAGATGQKSIPSP
jgi:hypothetical protein